MLPPFHLVLGMIYNGCLLTSMTFFATAPSATPHTGLPLSSTLDEAQRTEEWERHTNETIQYSTDTMALYGTRFEARALARYREAVQFGLADGSEE